MARMKVICDSGCCSRMLIVSYSGHPRWSYASFITITAHRQRDYHQWSKWFFRPIMTIVTSKRPKSIGSMEICSIIVHAFLVIRGKFFFYFYDEKYVCPLPDQCCKNKKKKVEPSWQFYNPVRTTDILLNLSINVVFLNLICILQYYDFIMS